MKARKTTLNGLFEGRRGACSPLSYTPSQHWLIIRDGGGNNNMQQSSSLERPSRTNDSIARAAVVNLSGLSGSYVWILVSDHRRLNYPRINNQLITAHEHNERGRRKKNEKRAWPRNLASARWRVPNDERSYMKGRSIKEGGARRGSSGICVFQERPRASSRLRIHEPGREIPGLGNEDRKGGRTKESFR